MKIKLLILALLLAAPSFAMERAMGYCQNGNQRVVTSGVNSTTLVQRSFPACTITVYLTGTLSLATIYSTNSGTPLANPFTASAVNGYWFFYAANDRYDVTLSGAGISSPYTWSDILLADPASFSTGVTSFNTRTGAVVPTTGDYTFSQISGDVTIHTHAGATQGGGPLVLGTIFSTQSANTFAAGPASAGPSAPTWRALVSADIPSPIASNTSGNAATATALAANGTNCSVGQFPRGVDASGNSENCLALPTSIAGTANQITASASTGAIVLSIPSSPTIPGTTTGTFVGNVTGNLTGNVTGNVTGALTGNATTATALAANPANCGAGLLPRGITAAGVAEGCAAVDLVADITGLLPVANMNAVPKVSNCDIDIGDPGAATVVLANDNDRPGVCSNNSGSAMTITAVRCYADAGTPSVTPILTGGGATSILTGALTCGTGSFASGTLNGTPSLVNNGTIDANITAAGGTARYIVIRITRTL